MSKLTTRGSEMRWERKHAGGELTEWVLSLPLPYVYWLARRGTALTLTRESTDGVSSAVVWEGWSLNEDALDLARACLNVAADLRETAARVDQAMWEHVQNAQGG